jgi:hypothetical protein
MAGGVKFPSSTIEDSWSIFRNSIGASDDIDDLRDSSDKYGFYGWGGTAPSNAPIPYGILIALNDASQGNQIVWGNTNQKLYLRRANSGTWTSWVEK